MTDAASGSDDGDGDDPTYQVFVSALRAITGCDSPELAEGLMEEFDRALPLPDGRASELAAAVVESTANAAVGHRFADATIAQRHEVLRQMLDSEDPLVREIVNLVVPFFAFAYWSDAIQSREASVRSALGSSVAQLPPWPEIGFPGPSSDGYLATYRRGAPRQFRAHGDERELRSEHG